MYGILRPTVLTRVMYSILGPTVLTRVMNQTRHKILLTILFF